MLVALAYGGLAFLIGDPMLPGGAAWCVFILWFCSIIVGSMCKMYKVPALLGNLIIGIVLKNLPGGIVDDLPTEWAGAIRSTGTYSYSTAAAAAAVAAHP